MVHFNFGLGGLMIGDDDKKDDSSTSSSANSGDGSSSAMPTDTGEQVTASSDENSNLGAEVSPETPSSSETSGEMVTTPTEETVETETSETPETPGDAPTEENPATDPVFEEKIQTTEVGKGEEVEENETENFAENVENNNSSSGLTTQDSEENWLNTEKTPANEESVNLETETPTMPTFGQPTEDTAEDEQINLGQTEEVEVQDELKEVKDESMTEVSTEENISNDSVSQENETDASEPEIPTFEQPTSSVESESNMPADESSAKISEPTENPFPEAAVPASQPLDSEKQEPATNEPFIPVVPKAQTELPTNENIKTDSVAEQNIPELTENFAETENKDNSSDFFSNNPPAETTINNSSDDLSTENPITETDSDPLAPAPTAVIGGDLVSDNEDKNDDNVSDQDMVEESSSIKTENPVVVLEQFKEKAAGFLEEHNRRIAEYNKKIAELKAKIREEKHILKEEQKKSAKILEELNSLVANFSQTNSIKKKVPKRINKRKFTKTKTS